jgi:hypothetical protein
VAGAFVAGKFHLEWVAEYIDEGLEDYIDLATRFAGPINVALFYDRVSGDLVVVAHDDLTGEDVRIPVEPHSAAEVFRHPFAYASKGQVVRSKLARV